VTVDGTARRARRCYDPTVSLTASSPTAGESIRPPPLPKRRHVVAELGRHSGHPKEATASLSGKPLPPAQPVFDEIVERAKQEASTTWITARTPYEALPEPLDDGTLGSFALLALTS